MSIREKIETRVFAARLKDKEALKHSSSGGVFTALSDYVLGQGGVVACSIYNYQTDRMEYQLISQKETRNSARGSKYVQSIPGNIFRECENWLQSNPDKKLLFVGTGCQAAGFKAYAEAKRFADRIYVADIICHGSPSPKLWKEYVEMLERMHKGDMEYVTFKDKRNGWNNPTTYALINQKEITLRPYHRIFMNGAALRPSCHECPYATTERMTDITIGDFWGIEKVMPKFYSEMGNSLVLIHNTVGQELWEQISIDMDNQECSVQDCLQPNLIHPTEKSAKREEFWQDYQSQRIEQFVKKYGMDSLWVKVVRKIKYILKIK